MTEEKTQALSGRALEEKLFTALSEALSRVSAVLRARSGDILQPLYAPLRVGVAFSGGRDSMALLEALWRFSLQQPAANPLVGDITALHVNHGISPNASGWEALCGRFAAARNIPFEAMRVTVNRSGSGLEAAAREKRYEAIAGAARRLNLDCVLTAHHMDDRLETFLMQWIRGAGVDGLSSMPQIREFGTDGELLVRPWLDVPRVWISTYAEEERLCWAEDESNADTVYLRNLIRHRVLPVIEEARPGFRKAAARSVGLVAEAAGVLRTVAEEDVKLCEEPGMPEKLRIEQLLSLPAPRQALCLRAWIQANGATPPARTLLTEALRQARQTHSDTALTIRVGSAEIRRFGPHIIFRRYAKPVRDVFRDVPFCWNGESQIPCAPWGGVFEFRRAAEGEAGIPGSVLREGPLEAKTRRGGERLKLSAQRPSRHLKHLFQEAGVPSFERSNLPLLWCGERLIYVAGLGAEIRGTVSEGADRWTVSWKADETLISGDFQK